MGNYYRRAVEFSLTKSAFINHERISSLEEYTTDNPGCLSAVGRLWSVVCTPSSVNFKECSSVYLTPPGMHRQQEWVSRLLLMRPLVWYQFCR